jgi:hypothetical protein
MSLFEQDGPQLAGWLANGRAKLPAIVTRSGSIYRLLCLPTVEIAQSGAVSRPLRSWHYVAPGEASVLSASTCEKEPITRL